MKVFEKKHHSFLFLLLITCILAVLGFSFFSNVKQVSAAPASLDRTSSGITSWQHTTGNQANRLLLVGASGGVTSVTYNNTALTRTPGGSGSSGTRQVTMWYLRNPPTGTYTIALQGGTGLNGAAITFYNVDQSNSFTTPGSFVGIQGYNGCSSSTCNSERSLPASSADANQIIFQFVNLNFENVTTSDMYTTDSTLFYKRQINSQEWVGAAYKIGPSSSFLSWWLRSGSYPTTQMGAISIPVRVNAYIAPTPTPTPPGNIVNLNFGITDLKPWIQSTCGDIRIDDGIDNPVPAGYYSIVTNASCSTPGVAFSGDQPHSFGRGQISTTSWLAGGTAYPETFTNKDFSGIFSSYANMDKRTTQAEIIPTDMETICTLSNCTLPANLPHGVYKANGNLSLNAYTFPNNQKYVFLINGTLSINGNLLIPQNSGSSALFSVANDIIVNASVGRIPSSSIANIEGFFSTDKSFIINSTGNCNDLRLNIAGAVITNASLTGGSFQNNRDLCNNNASAPTVSISQRLDFLFNAPEFIMKKNTLLWEGAP